MVGTSAILNHSNSLRVFGPPGSGKTRWLVDIGKTHVEKGDFNVREAIIVSFTRAAAEDIATRILVATTARSTPSANATTG